jgi:predicted dehydrogenase
VTAEKADVPIMVGHRRRHNPIMEAARDVVASGQLGRIVGVNLRLLLRKAATYFDVA